MRKKRKQQKLVLMTVVILILAVGAFAVQDAIRKILVIELPLDLLHVKEHVGELAQEPEIREQNPDVLFITGPDFTMPEAQQSSEAELLLREQYKRGTIEESTCQQQNRFTDKCYLLLARQTKQVYYCTLVEDMQKRDLCFMNHVLTKDNIYTQDMEICAKINNVYLQKSCLSLNK